jgi:hypothetical protein
MLSVGKGYSSYARFEASLVTRENKEGIGYRCEDKKKKKVGGLRGDIGVNR